MSVVGLTSDPRAGASKPPTRCLLGPLWMKAGSARKLGQEMKLQRHPAGAPSLSETLSPQISKTVMKQVLARREANVFINSSSSLRIFGGAVGESELCKGKNEYWIPLAIPSRQRLEGAPRSLLASDHQEFWPSP